MKKYIVLLFVCLSVSCSQYESKHAESDLAAAEPAPAPELKITHVNSPSSALIPVNTNLIKTADYRFKVTDVKKSTDHIEAGLIKYQAFISSSNLTTLSHELESHIVVKVRNEHFDDLLKHIDSQAILIHHRNVSTQDVSKEFVDLKSRLKTKREVESRYMDILRSKAGTIEELLDAEEKIGQLHEEIEATVSRINFLKDQVAYSTINLEFYQPLNEVIIAEENNSLTAKMGDALNTGFEGVLLFVVAILYVWPVIIIALSIVMFLKFRKKSVSV
jgi:hypothetical protein